MSSYVNSVNTCTVFVHNYLCLIIFVVNYIKFVVTMFDVYLNFTMT